MPTLAELDFIKLQEERRELAAVDALLQEGFQLTQSAHPRLHEIARLQAAGSVNRGGAFELLGQALGDSARWCGLNERVQMLIDELELERGELRTTAENRDLAREQVRQLWTALQNLTTAPPGHQWQRAFDRARAALAANLPVPADEPPGPAFRIGQRVRKVTGDYNIAGEVRSVFATVGGAIRYVVEHQAEGGGSFLHVYGEANLVAEPA